MFHVLVLDDDAQRQAKLRGLFDKRAGTVSVVCESTAIGAIARLLSSERFELVFLDHDLDGEASEGQAKSPPNSGLTVAQLLASVRFERPRMVVVHSCNGPRARTMVETLRVGGVTSYGVEVAKITTATIEELLMYYVEGVR